MKIKTKLIASFAAFMMAISPAMALDQFFQKDSGQWSIEGYVGEKNFCAAKTYWQDGSYVSLFTLKNSDTFSLMVHNESWNIVGDFGGTYMGRFEFRGNLGSNGGEKDFELVDKNTVIFRDLNANFMKDWSKYSEMYINMPNDVIDVGVGLTGTERALIMFAACVVELEIH